jgi:broad specificity phosphatase PhoE
VLSLSLLRHGAVDPRPFVLWGQLDPPTSAAGLEAMAQATRAMSPLSGILSSPLRRCRDFALPFASARGLPCAVHDGLKEMHFGAWQGLTPQDCIARDGTRYASFQTDPEVYPPPEGEALADFRTRVLGTMDQWRATRPDGHWLCVTHGGVIRVLLMEWLGLQQHWRVAVPPATCLRLLLQEGGEPVLLSLCPPCAD